MSAVIRPEGPSKPPSDPCVQVSLVEIVVEPAMVGTIFGSLPENHSGAVRGVHRRVAVRDGVVGVADVPGAVRTSLVNIVPSVIVDRIEEYRGVVCAPTQIVQSEWRVENLSPRPRLQVPDDD